MTGNPVTIGARRAVVGIFKFVWPLSVIGTVLMIAASVYGGHYEFRTLILVGVTWPIVSMLIPMTLPLVVLGVASALDLLRRKRR
jgi:hypothetical protein